jgi:adenylate kinase family enzyme
MGDCKINGWVLVGAPNSPDQIGMMKEFYNQQPTLIITIEMSDNLIYEKLE